MTSNNRGFGGKVKVRFKRSWRGYRAGDEITPPAGLREQLLRTTTPLGEPVAELVDVPLAVEEIQAPAAEAPAEESEGLLAGLVGSKGKKSKAKKD